MKTYVALINLVSGMQSDKIISGLVKLGYGVGCAAANPSELLIGNKDTPSSILALQIIGEIDTVSDLHKIIKGMLINNNISYFSITCVHSGSEMCWGGSNISLQKLKEQSILKRKANHLKLVPISNNITTSEEDVK